VSLRESERSIGVIFPERDEDMDVVYFVQSICGGPVKIGTTRRLRMDKRLQALQTGNPERLHIVRMIRGGVELERAMHARFKHLRLQGEWFEAEDELAEWVSYRATPDAVEVWTDVTGDWPEPSYLDQLVAIGFRLQVVEERLNGLVDRSHLWDMTQRTSEAAA
jgi:hypothetical protein